MVNRCDSVDALMYAYYEMMRIKEENQMLKKNKDYVEFTLQYTSVDWERRSKDYPEVCLKGYSDFSFPGVPIMDVVCNEFDHKVVVVSKRDFEKMQADVNINAEIAKQWEINYDLLLKKIGFDTVEELVNYLGSEAECDTLREAIASLEYSVKFARDERRDLSKKLEECEKDYISERDKAEALQTENEQLKKKLEEFSPDLPGYREFLTALYPEADVEKMIWATKHIFGCRSQQDVLQSDLEYYRAMSSVQAKSIYRWKKVTGFSTCEEIEDYLVNEAECDTLHEAISKLHDQVKYTCDEWYSANSRNNSWKAAAECNSPKDFLKWKTNVEEIIEAWKDGTGCKYPGDARRLLEKWKTLTKCETPEAAATWITSYESACERGNRLAESVKNLKEEIDSWKNVTGYSTPEDYIHARISGAFHTPFDYTAAWQKATGCDTPEAAKCRINNLIGEAEAWESDYNHLLALTGFDNEDEIEDFLEQNNDRNKLTTVIDNLKLENETMKTALRASNFAMQKELDQEIDKWQKATGRTDPEAAKQYIDRLKGRLNKIHSYSVDC